MYIIKNKIKTVVYNTQKHTGMNLNKEAQTLSMESRH